MGYFSPVDGPELITRYFPGLNDRQKEQFAALKALYAEWNAKINVISRKDLDHFYVHHVLHSLAIAKYTELSGRKVMDIGTGGGFPGIPLAILFTEAEFLLVDSIGKKIRVVETVLKEAGVSNAAAVQSRAEDIREKVDVVVSRATAPFSDLVAWSKGKFTAESEREIIALKGGELEEELRAFPKAVVVSVSTWFSEPFFETKKLVSLKK